MFVYCTIFFNDCQVIFVSLYTYNLGQKKEHLDHPSPHFSDSKMVHFAPLCLHHCFGGDGGLFQFNLSKIVQGPHWHYKKLSVLCRSHLICCHTFNNQGKGMLAEIRPTGNKLCAQFKQQSNLKS